jgi:hypothetical protein
VSAAGARIDRQPQIEPMATRSTPNQNDMSRVVPSSTEPTMEDNTGVA